jgi:hypothetical protein
MRTTTVRQSARFRITAVIVVEPRQFVDPPDRSRLKGIVGGIAIVMFYQITAVKKDEQVGVDFYRSCGERVKLLRRDDRHCRVCRILRNGGGRKMPMSVRYPCRSVRRQVVLD